jgi:hypothetical protein
MAANTSVILKKMLGRGMKMLGGPEVDRVERLPKFYGGVVALLVEDP